MQVVLGAGGAIGKELAKELKTYDEKIRLFSRNPQKINEDDELFPGNLMDFETVEKAVEGARVAYLTAGLPYRSKIWETQWPVIMESVISACKKKKVRLVFFDNMYLYHPDKLNPMTEETEVQPASRKGKVRAKIAEQLLDEVSQGKPEALIARAPDFYGPGVQNALFNKVVIKNLRAGKNAKWFCSTRYLHNFIYTPDAAKATALLGNTDSAYGQVWHLPTVEPKTMQEWIDAVAKEWGVSSKTNIIAPFMLKLAGWFNPLMKEMHEMLYQYDRDYNFDSSKFETVFNVKPTAMEKAIKEILESDN